MIRSRLNERKWTDFVKQDANPYQTWSRIRSKVQLALREIALLARRLPNDKQDKLFTIEYLEPLFRDVLLGSPEQYDESDYRRTHLCAQLVRIAVEKCIIQYKLIESNEILREPVIEKLVTSVRLCEQIAAEMGNQSRKS